MIADKLRSLKKALHYSYQAETAILYNTGEAQEFKCLINPNKLSMELDDKMLSIPFSDTCLTTGQVEDTLIKVGDVIGWKETNTHWLIYSQYLQENAYFRGLMRECEQEPLEIDGKQYWYYLKGPDEKTIDWQKTKHFVYNTLNYSLEIYISNNSETKQFFHRFKKINLKGKPYEVQAIDDITTEGIIAIYLKEDFTNEFGDTSLEEAPVAPLQPTAPQIIGDAIAYPFDIKKYTVSNISGGQWSLSNKRARILQQDTTTVEIEIISGKSGDTSLIYSVDGMENIVFNIQILSL